MVVDTFRELADQFRTVLNGRSTLFDVTVPPVAFVGLNALAGFEVAVWGALAFAALIVVVRLMRHQPLRYAFGGVGGTVLAIAVAWLVGRAAGYLLPSLLSGAVTVLVAVGSVVVRRPMVAWTSALARRWPWGWYWHPRVRPAYSEVTLAWAAFYIVRLALQLFVFRDGDATALAAVQIATGWPATVVLLVLSYLYGTWRLRHLGGPSVEEFTSGAEPPWAGQQRGF
ncbi:MAG: DUF3159 domain-containing protein [Anaerolineae bacterium]|nr:DUF3159 domain-containing protein [Anaerolineae bacterium]